jgi:hypothetical protein
MISRQKFAASIPQFNASTSKAAMTHDSRGLVDRLSRRVCVFNIEYFSSHTYGAISAELELPTPR